MEAKEYWNNRYASGGNSGYGSYGEQLDKKLKWLSDLPISDITEIGCGDFNFGSHLMEIYPEAKYWGFDTSDVIITQNKQKYPQYNFTNNINDLELPPSDLVLCIDVLFHVLDDGDYEKLLKDLEWYWTKYLAVTAHEDVHAASPHLNIRKFDYTRFGKPLIREVVEEDGQLYFYLWKK